MKTLKIGLIGCGVMGRSLAKSLLNIDCAKLAVVCDPFSEAARAAAKEFGVPSSTEVNTVLGRKRLDGVIVATPPFKHKEVCNAAAKAGKHVFVEKPLAATVKDCNSIIRAAKQAKIKLMVGQVCRYHGVHRRVRDMVKEGAIGDPIYMHVHRIGGGFGGIWAKSWRNSRKMSGGTLMEVNAHEIDFMRFVCGEVVKVYAAGGNFVSPETDYPDVASLTLHFEGGAIGHLHSSSASAIGGFGGRVDGTKGSLHFPQFWGAEGGIHHKRHGEETNFIPASDIKVLEPVQAELEAWLNAILNDEEPEIPGAEGRANVHVAEAAYESIETGRVIEL
ncbi:MAG: Gfo/Idh/MocA family oxidoreductase [Planctomycetota bacterium]|nr:Gfo/Idh/MocA family oxidoreductase [Planctomycetota bacterium]